MRATSRERWAVSNASALEQTKPAGDELFRLLVENVRDYAIFLLDPHGRVMSWNAGAQRIKGYAKNEIIGRHFSVFYTADAIARRWPAHELTLALREGRFEDEGWRLRKDGTTFWANVVITPLFDDTNSLRGFAKITRDLTARRKVEELQRTERQMNEFLAMLAHELRNPLAPIQSALDVVAQRPDDLATSRWARAIIGRQTQQLSRLVDDLLDVSRITRGKISLRHEPVDVKATIADVVEALHPEITTRRHVVTVTVPEQPVMIDADPTRLAQVLDNLLSNAAKYTPDGGRIAVDAAVEAGVASITITDNGIGMSADLVPRVFTLFVQGERGLDRREGGLGVGLTIAKRLADMQGGSLVAASAGPGLGSRFTLGFPALSPDRMPTEPATTLVAAATRRRRVLIVDDNEDAAESLATLIGILGHDATVLHDGQEALGMAAAARPDLMLLDIGLPGMDGFEVARRLRTIPELKDVRLIACTGYGRDEDIRRIDAAGFDRHLVKPVSAAQIEQLLGD
jgi:PAS domain S-box-containing protein